MFSTEDSVAVGSVAPPLGRRTAVATAGALVAGAAGFAVAHAAGQELLVSGREGSVPVPLGAVFLAVALGGVAAYALARAARRTAHPRTAFGVLVAMGLALSSVPPLAAARDHATSAWLLALHAVVAAVLVPAVLSALPARRVTRP